MMTSPGVQTPSTSRANRLRQPLESPFPSSSSPPASAAATGAEDASSSSSHSRDFGLSDGHLREIKTVFQIFDPSLSGHIDISTFEVMVRSLGFRMTRVEIADMVEFLREDNQRMNNNAPINADERQQVDLPTAIQILAKRGYVHRNEEDETLMYFRIFDGGSKGYITLEDLQRVQNEVKEAEREMDIGSDGSGMDVGVVGDATLQAMIEQFDQNDDGVLDYEEFKNILGPVLSSSPSSSS